MKTTSDSGQRRAKAGGEFGANGDWYEGGKFIATDADTIKTAPRKFELSAAQIAERDAYAMLEAARMAEVMAARDARAAKFADTLAILRAQQTDFHASLADAILSGPISARQCNYVLKAVFGRCNKRNEAAWLTLADALTI